MKYLIVVEETSRGYSAYSLVEETSRGYSAYSPDLPGCVATGATRAQTQATMQDAIRLHVDGLRGSGQPVPPATTTSAYAEVPA